MEEKRRKQLNRWTGRGFGEKGRGKRIDKEVCHVGPHEAWEGIVDSRSQRDTYEVDGERNGWSICWEEVAERQTLEFGVQFGGWKKPAGTNGPYIH